MATQPHRFTVEDVESMPVPPHLRGYELVNGELIEVSPVTFQHGAVAAALALEIGLFLRRNDLGRVSTDPGFAFSVPGDPERLRGPDVVFVSHETMRRLGGNPKHGFMRGVPDLVAEIISPGDKIRDFNQKIRDYLDGGVKLVWAIYPDARYATAYRADNSAQIVRDTDYLDGEDVMPGFRMKLGDLFE